MPGKRTLVLPVKMVSPMAKWPGLLMPMTSPGYAACAEGGHRRCIEVSVHRVAAVKGRYRALNKYTLCGCWMNFFAVKTGTRKTQNSIDCTDDEDERKHRKPLIQNHNGAGRGLTRTVSRSCANSCCAWARVTCFPFIRLCCTFKKKGTTIGKKNIRSWITWWERTVGR